MFNIEPCGNVAIKARATQASKVKKSIAYLINEYDSKIPLNNIKKSSLITTLNNMCYLHPRIHYLHYALQTSMRNNNAIDASLAITKLKNSLKSAASNEEYINISSVGHTDWEKFVITEAKRLTLNDANREAVIESIDEKSLSVSKDHICAALCLITRYDSKMFDEIKQHVKFIKLFQGKTTMGFTDVRMLGAMLLKLPSKTIDPILYFAEHIIHESCHIHLNCLMSVDPLILNSPDERFCSPLRVDPRPMIGVFHATYVSVRIARTFMKIYNSTKNKELLQIIAETIDESLRGIAVIEKSARLTEKGISLLASMKDFINQAMKMPEWKKYNFNDGKTHRYGAGPTKVSSIKKRIYETNI